MDRIPLFFNRSILVAGRGFIARVSIEGRCILERTGEGFVSFLGVNPGAAAGQGETQSDAYHDFLETVRLVVVDLAEEAPDFEPFKSLVESFVLETNRPFETAWRTAVADVHAGKVDRSDFPGVVDAERPVSVNVELIAEERAGRTAPARQLAPDLNQQDEDLPLVAVG
jgi:hypothetical protein